MTAEWVIAEADRLLVLHPADDMVRLRARFAHDAAESSMRHAEISGRLMLAAARWLAKAEVAHKGSGDVDAIAARILDGVS